ncbi:MAG: hypothetical protein JEY96_08880 [Bacteroidales bacterium]|nr:hypothetical protein [Bacteroidales bacterium]
MKKIIAILRSELSVYFCKQINQIYDIILVDDFEAKQTEIDLNNCTLLLTDCHVFFNNNPAIFEEKPFIFLNTLNSFNSRPYYHSNFIGAVSFDSLFSFKKTGICNSFFNNFYYSENTHLLDKKDLAIRFDSKKFENTPPNILFVPEKCNDNYRLIYQLIEFFNYHDLFNLTICETENRDDYKHLLNDNINIVSSDLQDIEHDFDVIITSGKRIFECLSYGKPIFIIGEKGYGGLLLAENFDYLISNNFEGRLGAVNGEQFLSEVFYNDLISLIDINWKKEGVELIYKVKQTIHSLHNSFMNYLNEKHLVSSSMSDNKLFLSLRPTISSAITTQSLNDDKLILRSMPYHKFNGTMDKDIYEFLEEFDGQKTVKEYQMENELEEDELIGFLKNLFKRKLTNFKCSNN